jgi:hypothetical protein
MRRRADGQAEWRAVAIEKPEPSSSRCRQREWEM